MIKKFVKDIRREDIPIEGATNAQMQWIFSKYDGTTEYSLRRFILKEQGSIPNHSHPWQHELFILSGEGVVTTDRREYHVRAGSAVYIPPGGEHGYRNEGADEFIFLCIIPNKGDEREFRYWTVEELLKAGKITCKICTFQSEDGKCTGAYPQMTQPEDMYWSFGGTILGCKDGELRKTLNTS